MEEQKKRDTERYKPEEYNISNIGSSSPRRCLLTHKSGRLFTGRGIRDLKMEALLPEIVNKGLSF